jgi:hypothetical protein
VTEEDKELRLTLINSWKQALMLNRMELETARLDITACAAKVSMLQTREALIQARMDLITLALDHLGVKNQ